MITVRAPGKVMLCGEYAVLSGAPAVVAAINRYARATIAVAPTPETPVVQEIVRRVREHLGSAPQHIAVQTSELEGPGQIKLGLGASAAVAVAAAGVLFQSAGHALGSTVRPALLEMCMEAHQRAQGGLGSGADVAASVMGGILQFARSGQQPRISPLAEVTGLHVAFVFTGKAASTSALLERVRASRADLGALPELAERFAQAWGRGQTMDILTTAGLYGSQMEKLGKRADAPILTPEHASLAKLARQHGGAAKPSGAGGGDVAVGFFAALEDARAFSAAALQDGMTPLALSIDHEGVSEI